jgi:uncharacterized protein YfaS (alpha-2-macroglobulin family)
MMSQAKLRLKIKLTVSQEITQPYGSIPGYGGLDISLSTSILNELTDAIIYLMDYPYGCNEQISSKLIALLSLTDVFNVIATTTTYTKSVT